jgi:hypothetical protein
MTHSVPARLTPRTEIDISRGITTGGSPGGHIGLTATARHSGPGRKTFMPNGNVVRAPRPRPRRSAQMPQVDAAAARRGRSTDHVLPGKVTKSGHKQHRLGLTVGTDTRSCCRSPRDGRSCVRLRSICTSPRRGLHILTVAPHLDLDLAGQRHRCCQLAGAGRRMPAGLVSPRRPARSGIRPRGCRR